MPERSAEAMAREDRQEGKSASTQAGEFVRDEMRRIRAGKHGARSTKQAIAIGLSRARRAGVDLPAPSGAKATGRIRRQARRDLAAGRHKDAPLVSTTRSRATLRALRREGREAASPRALARQARRSARGKSARLRSAIARRAAHTRNRIRHSRGAK